MFDYRLKVFDTVARRLSFTKAAEELCITQPAVSKHVHELERQFGIQLFERKGNRIVLTQSGLMILKYTESLREISRQLEYEINLLKETHRGYLKLGASTTIAQYVLPPLLARFHHRYKDVQLHMLNANTEQIELALLQREIELGVIEGDSKRKEIHYTPFTMDEIVLVSSAKNPLAKKGEISIEKLAAIPMLLRESGSGTLEVIVHALKNHGMKVSDLNIEMYLGSSEAIKSYLIHSNCMAFISQHAVIKEVEAGSLKIISLKKLSIQRHFYFITLHGTEGGLPEVFMRFADQNYSDVIFKPH